MIEVQTIRVDPEGRRAWRGEEELRLSRKEFDLLHVLISNAGEVVSRDELMERVWHTSFWTSSKTIDVHLGWLRRKIGDDARRPHLITTLRGRGLRFERTAAEPRPAERDVTLDLTLDASRRDVTGEQRTLGPAPGDRDRPSLRAVASVETGPSGAVLPVR